MQCSKPVPIDVALAIARRNLTSARLGIRVLPWHEPAELVSRNGLQTWLEACGEDIERLGLFLDFQQVDWAAIVEALARCQNAAQQCKGRASRPPDA